MISRRKFLVVTAALTATAAGGMYVARPHLRRLINPELDLQYPLGVLNEPDASAIVALGEAVAAPESVPPADFFRDYVNIVTQSQRGYLKEYQRAVSLLDSTAMRHRARESARGFSELSRAERDQVLRALLWPYPAGDRIRPKAEKLAAPRDALALRQFVMTPLIEHYYRSEYGWKVVGYQKYPGTQRNVVDYTALPSDSEAA